MSFISDLLVEISSFRIRIGNKLNALKTLIDGKAEIDGSNIPAGTFWSQFKASGVGNYIYVDVQENDFSRVMVWKNGGWAWTNKDGFSSWLGLVPGSHNLLTNVPSGHFTNGGYILLCIKSNSNAIRIAGMLTLQRQISSGNSSNATLNFSLSTDNNGNDLRASFTDITTSNVSYTYNFV